MQQFNERPKIPRGSHPIETGKYLLATNQINYLLENTREWIENRTPGAIVFGKPRLGKTRAILYLTQKLHKELGETFPIYHIRCKQNKMPTENVFFENLLIDVDHYLPSSGVANAKRQRFTKFLLEKADSSGENKVVLFIDDAQSLFDVQYQWLMDIYNDLDHYGVTMTVILVGQEELIEQRSAFFLTKKNQIIGRFMVQEHEFHGIIDLNDLSICLEDYDNAQYPKDLGWSFTRYFFPESFDEGFRLQSCAEELYNVFLELKQESKKTNKIEIPMQYLTLTIEIALKRFGINGFNVGCLSKNHWKEAVERSGYRKADLYQ